MKIVPNVENERRRNEKRNGNVAGKSTAVIGGDLAADLTVDHQVLRTITMIVITLVATGPAVEVRDIAEDEEVRALSDTPRAITATKMTPDTDDMTMCINKDKTMEGENAWTMITFATTRIAKLNESGTSNIQWLYEQGWTTLDCQGRTSLLTVPTWAPIENSSVRSARNGMANATRNQLLDTK